MGTIVAIAALKGGVGKTTVAVNVAGALQSPRRRVVVVDADPQGSASLWGQQGRLPFSVVSLVLDGGGDAAAKKWLAQVGALSADAAVVLVDLPPQLGAATQAALVVAAFAVVPVTPSGMDLIATQQVVELVQVARQARGGEHPGCVFVPARVDRRTAAGRELEETLEHFGEAGVIGPALGQRSAHVDAFSAGQWVGDYAPRSVAAAEVRALASIVEWGIRKWRNEKS